MPIHSKNDRHTETERLKKQINSILDGIDRTELDNNPGWWETSDGASFGSLKLKQIMALFDEKK